MYIFVSIKSVSQKIKSMNTKTYFMYTKYLQNLYT